MNQQERARLLWRCRRGIKEMDLLLKAFIFEYLEDLSIDQRRCFDALLSETDLDIIAWINGSARPAHENYSNIIKLLQKTAGKFIAR